MKVDESESTIYLKNDYGGGNVFEPSVCRRREVQLR